jgi:hypothetical protein
MDLSYCKKNFLLQNPLCRSTPAELRAHLGVILPKLLWYLVWHSPLLFFTNLIVKELSFLLVRLYLSFFRRLPRKIRFSKSAILVLACFRLNSFRGTGFFKNEGTKPNSFRRLEIYQGNVHFIIITQKYWIYSFWPMKLAFLLTTGNSEFFKYYKNGVQVPN